MRKVRLDDDEDDDEDVTAAAGGFSSKELSLSLSPPPSCPSQITWLCSAPSVTAVTSLLKLVINSSKPWVTPGTTPASSVR